MAIDLSTVKKTGDSNFAPRIVIYGPHGVGKTSLAAEFPNPILIDLEEGAPSDINIPAFPQDKLETLSDFYECIMSLYTQKHDFKTVIIDSADVLQELIYKKLCAEHNWKNIESPGFGKGYAFAAAEWQEIIKALRGLNKQFDMTTIIVAHNAVARFDDPQSASYSQHKVNLQKTCEPVVTDSADLVLFLNQDATVVEEDQGHGKVRNVAAGGATRFAYAQGRPAYDAKNRYGMPESFVFTKGKGFQALSGYIPFYEMLEAKMKSQEEAKPVEEEEKTESEVSTETMVEPKSEETQAA